MISTRISIAKNVPAVPTGADNFSNKQDHLLGTLLLDPKDGKLAPTSEKVTLNRKISHRNNRHSKISHSNRLIHFHYGQQRFLNFREKVHWEIMKPSHV